ncbi:MAG: hypothetical protein J6I36_00040 [Bacteroidaceae bacterium]|nr:hypothetical protein [Bacteroidaceae bacterium]
MKQTRILMLAVILTLCGTMTALAQIDPQVTEIMRKCEKVMSNPAGLEMTMSIEARMVIKLSGITATVSEKNGKSKASMIMKVLGREVKTEEGFDGTQEWSYRHIDLKKKGKEVKDTLTIKKTAKKSESDYDIDFSVDKEYKTATVKVSGRYYELTFTNPIKKDDPKKMVVKIDKDKYYFREMKAKQSGVSMTMTVTKIKFGVSDDVFKFDPKNYPNAIIVRK